MRPVTLWVLAIVALLGAAWLVFGAKRAEPAAEGGRVRISGTMTVLDPEGRELAEQSGSFSTRSGRDRRDVAIEDDAWSVWIEPSDELTISSLMIGGRIAYLDVTPFIDTTRYMDASWMAFPEDGKTVPLRARLPRKSILRVVDEESEADLQGVWLIRRHESDHIHPQEIDPAYIVLADVSSPFEIPDREGEEVYWVRAEDYAWGRITIDHASGGERLLPLPPDGAIRVSLDNLAQPDRTWVRVWTSEGLLYFESQTGPGGEVLVDGVPPGEYTVRAEIGPLWSPFVLASEEFGVRPLELTEAALELADLPDTTKIPVSGTLSVPPAWNTIGFSLNIEPFGGLDIPERRPAPIPGRQMRFLDEATGTYSWNTRIPPGEYMAVVSPWVHTTVFEISDEVRDVQISVPEPVDVVVHVRDAATDEPLADSSLRWSWFEPRRIGGPGVELPRGGGVFRFRAPLGVITVVSVGGPDHQGARQLFELGTVDNEFVLYLRPRNRIRITLMDGGVRVPFDGLTEVSAEQVGGDGTVASWGGGGSFVGVTEPGRYRVTIPEVEGYQPVPVQEVDVPSGGVVDLVIDLQRK